MDVGFTFKSYNECLDEAYTAYPCQKSNDVPL